MATTGKATELEDVTSTRNSDGTCTCGACRKTVRPRKHVDPLAWVCFPVAIGMAFLALPATAVMPPLNMTVVPPLFLIVTGLWGFSTGEIFKDPSCPSCGRIMVFKKK